MSTEACSQVYIPMINRALEEDLGGGDVTSMWTIPQDHRTSGHLVTKAAGVLAGMAVAAQVFKNVDHQINMEAIHCDGVSVSANTIIANVIGPTRSILIAERTALNFLQRMSGIATMTKCYVDAVTGTKAIILDTRKTAPGLRYLDKWAVRLGGGFNHRSGLYDMVLIKDNHISAAGSITTAVERVRALNHQHLAIEIEVRTPDELLEALSLNPDRILLDNMTIDELSQAVIVTDGRVPLEASGGVTLETTKAIASTGVDFISVGALTHSVQALDISFLLRVTKA